VGVVASNVNFMTGIDRDVDRITGSTSATIHEYGSQALGDRLKQVAADEAYRIEMSALEAQEERLKLQTRSALIEEQLEEANRVPDRLARFQPEIAGHLQCPRCWIAQNTRSILACAPTASGQHDLLRCKACHLELSASSHASTPIDVPDSRDGRCGLASADGEGISR
jgi:hypothetical protein